MVFSIFRKPINIYCGYVVKVELRETPPFILQKAKKYPYTATFELSEHSFCGSMYEAVSRNNKKKLHKEIQVFSVKVIGCDLYKFSIQ